MSCCWICHGRAGPRLPRRPRLCCARAARLSFSLPAPAFSDLNVGDLVNGFVPAKAKQGRCDRDSRALLRSFAKGRDQRPADRVTTQEVEAWLDREE